VQSYQTLPQHTDRPRMHLLQAQATCAAVLRSCRSAVSCFRLLLVCMLYAAAYRWHAEQISEDCPERCLLSKVCYRWLIAIALLPT
jgi:hypothetical protein